METIFLVKSIVVMEEGHRISRIHFTSTVDYQEVRDFALMEEHPEDIDRVTKKVEEFLSGKRRYFQTNFPNKYAVRCEVQQNEMLQIYEIVKTIKGA